MAAFAAASMKSTDQKALLPPGIPSAARRLPYSSPTMYHIHSDSRVAR